MILKIRCFHLAVAGLLLWSLGVSGVCEARCLELALGGAAHERSSADPTPAPPEPSCHGGTPAPAPEPAGSLDPSASSGEPACHCAHVEGALLQQRADTERPRDAFPAVALVPRAAFAGAVLRAHVVFPNARATLAPHQYRNPPLLI